MMTSEEILKNYICTRYKSVRQFCSENDLKYSTVVAMLSRGLRNSNIDTVFPVCKALGIKVEPLVKDGMIVELDPEPNHKQTKARVAAFYKSWQVLNTITNYHIDGIPLSPEETKIMVSGFEALTDQIRKYRKLSEKESKK